MEKRWCELKNFDTMTFDKEQRKSLCKVQSNEIREKRAAKLNLPSKCIYFFIIIFFTPPLHVPFLFISCSAASVVLDRTTRRCYVCWISQRLYTFTVGDGWEEWEASVSGSRIGYGNCPVFFALWEAQATLKIHTTFRYISFYFILSFPLLLPVSYFFASITFYTHSLSLIINIRLSENRERGKRECDDKHWENLC